MTLPLNRVGDKGAYLGAVIDALSPDVPPVLVSPSMSGSFVVPFLADTPEKVDEQFPFNMFVNMSHIRCPAGCL